ncbi:MAG: ABC transporter permease [Gemmatimonadota bacterium]|nr:ABC transporter permease [Gemmatimonadota bacterium]
MTIPTEAVELRGSGPHRALPMAHGRFISRRKLALTTLYWFAWLSVSRRAAMGTGVRREFESLGVGALRLVASSAVLMGLIATFQVAAQLAQYGAQSISISAVGWFGARELGPLAVALLVVARSASAIAGELASMRANAEIDALRAMGLDPVKYLIAPKLAALFFALPFLTIIADGLITLGGWIGSEVVLGFGTSFFFEQFRAAFTLRDMSIGIFKSVVFAFLIVFIAADEGLNVESRVTAISEAATRAVIFSVLGVLAADTVVNAVFYFIPKLL